MNKYSKKRVAIATLYFFHLILHSYIQTAKLNTTI